MCAGIMKMLSTNYKLILRLMIRMYSRGYNMSFGEIQAKLKLIDDIVSARE